jgi:membrane protein CcdC involved in cytochrome C biogenesis
MLVGPMCHIHWLANLADFVKPNFRISTEQFLFGVLVVVVFSCLLSTNEYDTSVLPALEKTLVQPPEDDG